MPLKIFMEISFQILYDLSPAIPMKQARCPARWTYITLLHDAAIFKALSKIISTICY